MKYVYFSLFLFAIVTECVNSKPKSGNIGLEEEWEDFKLKHDRKYPTVEEDIFRKAVFSQHLFKIKEHNRLYSLGLKTYKAGVNMFSDLTDEEMTQYTGLKLDARNESKMPQIMYDPDLTADLPDQLDWRDVGAVTSVKNQKQCGSCWAFSAVGSLEGQYFLKTGKLVSLSPQNLVDCSKEGEDGCGGGKTVDAFYYVYVNNGIDSAEGYPYKAKQQKCRYKQKYNVTNIKYFGMVKRKNEESLKSAVATIGPITVSIRSSTSLHFYESGVYYNRCCDDKKKRNHAVLVVGYGTTEDGLDYWLVKNSWGPTWGENGFIRMARNKDNNCNIATRASFPIL